MPGEAISKVFHSEEWKKRDRGFILTPWRKIWRKNEHLPGLYFTMETYLSPMREEEIGEITAKRKELLQAVEAVRPSRFLSNALRWRGCCKLHLAAGEGEVPPPAILSSAALPRQSSSNFINADVFGTGSESV